MGSDLLHDDDNTSVTSLALEQREIVERSCLRSLVLPAPQRQVEKIWLLSLSRGDEEVRAQDQANRNAPGYALASLGEYLARFKVRMSKNGEFIEEGSRKNSLKSSALCLTELSAAIARRFPDEPLRAGEVVSSGTLIGRRPPTKGDFWKAEVEGIELPSLTLRPG